MLSAPIRTHWPIAAPGCQNVRSNASFTTTTYCEPAMSVGAIQRPAFIDAPIVRKYSGVTMSNNVYGGVTVDPGMVNGTSVLFRQGSMYPRLADSTPGSAATR
jgi:hypothetical protein